MTESSGASQAGADCLRCGCPEAVHETKEYRGDKSRACIKCRSCRGFKAGAAAPDVERLKRYSPNSWGQMVENPPDDWPTYYKKKDVEKLLSAAHAREAALRARVKAAYQEGFATAQDAALATTADEDDIEPYWQQSLAKRTGERQLLDADVVALRAENERLTAELSEARQNCANFFLSCIDGEAHVARLEAALKEALDEWADSSQYKGDSLRAKHGDVARIAELRAALAEGGGV